jgi:hypothetical protein
MRSLLRDVERLNIDKSWPIIDLVTLSVRAHRYEREGDPRKSRRQGIQGKHHRSEHRAAQIIRNMHNRCTCSYLRRLGVRPARLKLLEDESSHES